MNKHTKVFYGGRIDTPDEIIDQITEILEAETQKEIFTLRVLDREPSSYKLDLLIVFKDKDVMMAELTIPVAGYGGRLAVQMQGKFI